MNRILQTTSWNGMRQEQRESKWFPRSMQVEQREGEQGEASPVEGQREPIILDLTKLLPQYKVILHNDDSQWAVYVAASLVKAVLGLTMQEAWQITLMAHTAGKAIVITCPQEAAEYYQERMQSFGLITTIEMQ